MIRIEKAHKYFNRFRKNQIHVINNTSLDFDNNGLVSLLGPSGCGKTTLLNAIGGLDRISRGKIYVDGMKISSRNTHKIDKIRNLNIGYIFQDYNLVPNMTVFENVELALKLVGIKNKKEVKERVNHVLETVGMYRYRNRPANMLSGGERQRVGIARAIVKNPKVIIADEPTGNLDSKNTIEVMNIIKAISRDKLVVLVTHEKELAHFYASRIIEIVDGEIKNDYLNDHQNDLDYKMDGRIYLKDIEEKVNFKESNVKINTYIEDEEKVDITLVIKHGNIYVQSNGKNKIEVIDENSGIEIINDHYKSMSKKEYEKYQFNLAPHKKKLKYSSIINPFSMMFRGFKQVFGYSLLKKALLIGFFISGMFILLGISNIKGVTTIKDEKFVTMNKNYLFVKKDKLKVNDYLSYESAPSVNYILPGKAEISFQIKYDDLLQSSWATDDLSGSLSSITMLEEKDIIYGRLPSNNNELVVDIRNFKILEETYNGKQHGYFSYKDYLNKEVTLNLIKYKIVGFTSQKSPSIYMNKDILLKTLMLNSGEEANTTETGLIYDYNENISKIKLKKGKLPLNDYEVIINENKKYEMPIGKLITAKVNGQKLKVVGYYTSEIDLMLVNSNTIKYNFIDGQDHLVVYPNNKSEAINFFQEKNLTIYDSYEKSKLEYVSTVKEKTGATVIAAVIIIGISLIEIFLIIRASFLSRIKEIGVYRAIGVKKMDIYQMFLGEIIAVTTLGGIPGVLFMNYILQTLTKSAYFSNMFMINSSLLILAILSMYAFNIIIGLIPVYNVIKKTPAQILSRTDIE